MYLGRKGKKGRKMPALAEETEPGKEAALDGVTEASIAYRARSHVRWERARQEEEAEGEYGTGGNDRESDVHFVMNWEDDVPTGRLFNDEWRRRQVDGGGADARVSLRAPLGMPLVEPSAPQRSRNCSTSELGLSHI